MNIFLCPGSQDLLAFFCLEIFRQVFIQLRHIRIALFLGILLESGHDIFDQLLQFFF